MIKWGILLLFMCKLILCVKIEIEYDTQLDLIYKDGVIYLRASEDIETEKALNLIKESQKETKIYNEEEEELVKGPELWLFILMILCKTNIFIIHSFNFIRWVNVWLDSRLSFN